VLALLVTVAVAACSFGERSSRETRAQAAAAVAAPEADGPDLCCHPEGEGVIRCTTCQDVSASAAEPRAAPSARRITPRGAPVALPPPGAS